MTRRFFTTMLAALPLLRLGRSPVRPFVLDMGDGWIGGAIHEVTFAIRIEDKRPKAEAHKSAARCARAVAAGDFWESLYGAHHVSLRTGKFLFNSGGIRREYWSEILKAAGIPVWTGNVRTSALHKGLHFKCRHCISVRESGAPLVFDAETPALNRLEALRA